MHRMSTLGLQGLLLGWVVALSVMLGGCDDGSGRNAPPPIDPELNEGGLRIVSLAPALTQMLIDMGYGNAVVGVAEHDAAAPIDLPVVGNYQDINTEALASLKPSLVLTMAEDGKTPRRLANLASRYRFKVGCYPYPRSVEDVFKIMYDDQEFLPGGQPSKTMSLGTLLDDPFKAISVVAHKSMQLGQIEKVTSSAPKPRVLMVIGVNPIMASGPGRVHHHLLTLFAGGVNAVEDAAIEAPTLDREKLLKANPDVILLLLPGAAPLKPIPQDSRLAELRGLDIPAVRDGRVVLINDPLVLLPSTSLARIGGAMAKAIHPDLSERIDDAMTQRLMASSRQTATAPPDSTQPATTQPATTQASPP